MNKIETIPRQEKFDDVMKVPLFAEKENFIYNSVICNIIPIPLIKFYQFKFSLIKAVKKV